MTEVTYPTKAEEVLSQPPMQAFCSYLVSASHVLEEEDKSMKAELTTDAQACVQTQKQSKIEENAGRQAVNEARLRIEEEERKRLFAEREEAQMKAKEEQKLRLQEEAKLKAKEKKRLEAQKIMRVQAEDQMKLKAAWDMQSKAREEARRNAAHTLKAAEDARSKAEEEARLKAKEDERLRVEEEVRLRAKEDTQRKAEQIKAEEDSATRPLMDAGGAASMVPLCVRHATRPEVINLLVPRTSTIKYVKDILLRGAPHADPAKVRLTTRQLNTFTTLEDNALLQQRSELFVMGLSFEGHQHAVVQPDASLESEEEEEEEDIGYFAFDKLQVEEETRHKEEEDARLKEEEEARLKAEEDARLKAEEEARLKAEQDARLRLDEELRLKAEEDARLKAAEEERLKAEECLRAQAEEEAKRKAAEDVRLKEEEAAQLKVVEEVFRMAEEEARLEAERKLKVEEDARLQAEQEARLKEEEDANLRREEEAAFFSFDKLQAEEEERLKHEKEVRLKVEQEARLKAEEHVRLKAYEAARHKADEDARFQADQAARKAEHDQRLAREEKARSKAVVDARLKAREVIRLRAEAEILSSTQKTAKLNAKEEEAARLKAEEQERLKAEAGARLKEEEQRKFEAEQEAIHKEKEETAPLVKLLEEEEKAPAEQERRWCPDTWWWYTFEELQKRYQNRFSQEELLEYWNWKMQREGGAENKDAHEAMWQLPSLHKFPHGTAHVARAGKSKELWPCRYLLLKPPGFEDSARPWPCLVFLHGHHEIGKPEYIAGLFTGNSRFFDQFALNNFVIIVPLAERGSGLLHVDNHQFDVPMVAKLLTIAMERLEPRVDIKRVSLTGYSMGADAAAQMIGMYGGLFAAAALFAGHYEWFLSRKISEASQLKGVEVRCFHNDLDSYVEVGRTNKFLEFMGEVCESSRPTVRSITIPYPSNILSFTEHMTALKNSSAHVQIRITQHDGGSKSSWVLRDAVHLSDAHVCWPIVYANEATFGLFHWMLQCGSMDKRRVWPDQNRRHLSMPEAVQFLGETKELFSSNPLLKEMSGKLQTKVGRDKFLYLAYVQRLLEVVQKNHMKQWGFRFGGPRGFLEMNAALSDNLAVDMEEVKAGKHDDTWRSPNQAIFQENWDAVRRNLYGNMYNDCWLPFEERGSAAIEPLPSEEAQRLREGSGFVSLEVVANKLRDELDNRLRQEAERARRKRLQEIRAKMTPNLTIDEAMDMQAELRDGFASPWFQDELATLHRQHGASPMKLSLLRAELIFEVQKDILIKYGFQGHRQSVHAMLQSFTRLEHIREFRETSDQCNYLLGLDHRFLTGADDLADTIAKSEEWKEFFRNGGWAKWNSGMMEQ